MNFADRFWRGVYAASNSFALMTQYPELLLYLGAAAPLYYVIQILFYNLPFIHFSGNELGVLLGMHSIHYALTELANWFINTLLITATFVYVFIINILNVALITHVTALLHHDNVKAHVRDVLKQTMQRIGTIFSWSIIFTFMSLVVRFVALSTYSHRLSAFSAPALLVTIFAGLWFLLTFFVLASIAVKNVGIIAAIHNSVAMVRILIIEILGSQVWMALVAMLCYTPLSTISRALSSSSSNSHTLFALIITGLTVLLSYAILSAQIILKTFLFNGYYDLSQKISEPYE